MGRQIVLFDRISADGYFADAHGTLDWVVPDEALDAAGAEAMPEADTILFGRKTYDMFEGFWPQALKNGEDAANPHGEGAAPAMAAMARWIHDATKLVFSRRRKKVTWANSRLMGAFDPAAIRALKKQKGKDIMIFGSGSVASLLTEHGLIDEYQLIVNPVLLGEGKSLIRGAARGQRLKLVEAKAFPSGNVRLRYAKAT